jgi:uncharacterized FAD-dependent dehydrogenase
MAAETYDVIIVGTGPAGIFAALELTKKPGLRVLMLDKGLDIDKRRCLMQGSDSECKHCEPCSMLSGWGGAGAYSDGKLTLSPEVGGRLTSILPREEVERLIAEVDAVFVHYGATDIVHGQNADEIERLQKEAIKAGLNLIADPIRHVGTDRSAQILRALRDELLARGVTIRMRSEVVSVLTDNNHAVGVELKDGAQVYSTFIVLAPGREGAPWLTQKAHELDLELERNPVDLGVRVELPATVLEPLTNVLYEPKLVYFSKAFDDRVRTFCVCPYGEVVSEWNGDVQTVNGHSYANRRTLNTNFALLVSKKFTEPFNNPIEYGKSIARLANLLGNGIIVQRLGDLEQGRRSTEERMSRSLVRPTLLSATPGDLGLVFPYRHLANLLEMLKAMDQLAPGVYSRHTLLYGVEVKFYSSRLRLSETLETRIQNLFAVGDGAGVTRGVIQASASGIVAARAILARA